MNNGRDYVRSMVRKRDNYTCRDCGLVKKKEDVVNKNANIKGLKGKTKSLDVHHLKGLCGKKSKGYDKIKDIKILITLCHKCHFNRPEHKSNKIIQSDKKVICLMRENGSTIREICLKYKVSFPTIYKILNKKVINT